MNDKVAKKIRKARRKERRELYGDLLTLPFGERWRIGWFIILHRIKTKGSRKV
jgi:hypothetical protein